MLEDTSPFVALAPLIGASMVAYVLLMMAIGYVSSRRVSDVDDYIVAGRRLGFWLATPTLLATWFGAGTLLTAADEVRDSGVTGATLDPIGAGICLLLVGVFFAKPMWEAQILTLPDFFFQKFGRMSEVLSSVLMIPPYFGWIAAQFMALSGMLHLFFGLDLTTGMALVAAVGFGYTLMGGMWAVTLTDAVQMALVIAGLLVLSVVVLSDLGGGSTATGIDRILHESEPQRLVLIQTQDMTAFLTWTGVLCAGALGNIPSQDVMQRVFSSRTSTIARWSCIAAGVLYLVLGCVPIIMGLAGHLLFEEGAQTLPKLAALFLHPWMAVLFVVTLMSVVLSTIDSALLAPSTVLARNILGHFKRLEHYDPLKLARWSLAIVAACSLGVGYAGESAYSLLESGYELGMVSLLSPLAFGIWDKTPSARGAMASMLAGTATWLLHQILGWETFFLLHESAPVGLSCTFLSAMAYLVFRERASQDKTDAAPAA